MVLNKGKHVVAEIEGVRSTVVETGLNESRSLFLKELLQQNGYEVKMEKERPKMVPRWKHGSWALQTSFSTR